MVFFAALFLSGTFLPAQDETDLLDQDQVAGKTQWYKSNASGITLELIPSRLAALRNEYCVSVETAGRGDLPELLLPYYDDSFRPYRIELRVLYEKGKELRRQWNFRDSRNFVWLTASGSGGLFGGESTGEDGEERRSGFIEIRDNEGSVVRELYYQEDLSEWDFRFFYQENTLLRAETWFKGVPVPETPDGSLREEAVSPDSEEDESAVETEEEEPTDPTPSFVLMTTDYYRYSRIGSLRAIERIIHEGARSSRTSFPRIQPGFSPDEELATGGIAYSSEFLLDIINPDGAKVTYALDSRGRIVSEIWKNEDGKVLGEYRNTWSADRLRSISWKSDTDERLIEYEYDDDGNRIVERNFRRGVLERSVTSRDGIETEEIYMNGRLVLRAFWEKGMKISEERITGGGRRP